MLLKSSSMYDRFVHSSLCMYVIWMYAKAGGRSDFTNEWGTPINYSISFYLLSDFQILDFSLHGWDVRGNKKTRLKMRIKTKMKIGIHM